MMEKLKEVLIFFWDLKFLFILLAVVILTGKAMVDTTFNLNHQIQRDQEGRTLACDQLYGAGNWYINYSAHMAPCSPINTTRGI